MGSAHLRHGVEEGDRSSATRSATCRLSANGEQMIIRREGDVFTTTVDKAFSTKTAGEKLDLGTLVYQVDVQKEWTQIFDDAWRWYRDFFYDPGMHGRDWKAMGEAYRAMIPSLSSRQELNWLLSQMVGELCVSHTYVGGGDMNQPTPAPALTFTGLLGAELVAGPAGRSLQVLPDLRSDGVQREPDRPARAAGRQRPRGRLPDRHQRPAGEAAGGLLAAAAVHRRTEDLRHGQQHAWPGESTDLRDHAGQEHPAAAVFPVAERQHQLRAQGLGRQGGVHAHQRHGVGGDRGIRQVLARVPLQGRARSSTCAAIRAGGRSTS